MISLKINVKQLLRTTSKISVKLKEFEVVLMKNKLKAMSSGFPRVAGSHNRYMFKIYLFCYTG